MNDRIPRSVVTGRRVAMTALVLAMVVTALLIVVLIAIWATQPVVV